MLVCEELFLLLTKDSGTSVAGDRDVYGLRGAVLADLALHQRIAIEAGWTTRFRLLSAAPTWHPALDQALTVLSAKNSGLLFHQIWRRRVDPRPGVVASLVAAGTVSVSKGGLLGRRTITPRSTPLCYPTLNPAPGQALRQRLDAVLHGRTTASQADRTLLAVLRGLGAVSTALPHQHASLGRRELDRRIADLAREDPVGSTVAQVVQSVVAAAVGAGAGAMAAASS